MITINIDRAVCGETIVLSVEEARKVYAELQTLFGDNNPPVVFDWSKIGPVPPVYRAGDYVGNIDPYGGTQLD